MKAKSTSLQKFKYFDFFGHGVSFLVDGRGKSQSFFGASVSLICAVLVGAYSIYQFQLMCRYSNPTVSYILNKNVFEETEIIQTSRLGFNIAFGIIDSSTFKGVEGIEKTGSLYAETMSFNKNSLNKESIPIQKCTVED